MVNQVHAPNYNYSNNKTKRGPRKKKVSSEKSMKIYYNNINGFNSKQPSLKKIVSELTPDIVVLCETKRSCETDETSDPEKNNTRCKKDDIIPGYKVIERNVKLGKEGLMVAARYGTFQNADRVTRSDYDNILAVRIEYKNTTIRLITLHAPQESDNLEERTDFYNEVTTQVERGVTAGDKVVVVAGFPTGFRRQGGGQKFSGPPP